MATSTSCFNKWPRVRPFDEMDTFDEQPCKKYKTQHSNVADATPLEWDTGDYPNNGEGDFCANSTRCESKDLPLSRTFTDITDDELMDLYTTPLHQSRQANAMAIRNSPDPQLATILGVNEGAEHLLDEQLYGILQATEGGQNFLQALETDKGCNPTFISDDKVDKIKQAGVLRSGAISEDALIITENLKVRNGEQGFALYHILTTDVINFSKIKGELLIFFKLTHTDCVYGNGIKTEFDGTIHQHYFLGIMDIKRPNLAKTHTSSIGRLVFKNRPCTDCQQSYKINKRPNWCDRCKSRLRIKPITNRLYLKNVVGYIIRAYDAGGELEMLEGLCGEEGRESC